MTTLIELRAMLEETNAALAVTQRDMAASPDSLAVSMTADSLEKRRRKLEEQFLAAADGLGVDVCNYRLFKDGEQPLAVAIADAIRSFQSLVSIVYSAIAGGAPKQRASVSAEVIAETSFGFGYTYPGSVGMVLTLPNERLLFGGSRLDDAMHAIFDMARAESASAIAEFAATLGPAPVREMYKWSDLHARRGLGADIEWRREMEVRAELVLQPPEIVHLRDTIGEVGDAKEEELKLGARLVGIDLAQSTFHLQVEGADDIRGRLAEGGATIDPTMVPALYSVALIRRTQTQYSTDEDRVTYELLRLEPA